jgi:hypothetical protein
MNKQHNEIESTIDKVSVPPAVAGSSTSAADPPQSESDAESQPYLPGMEAAEETPEGVTLTRLQAENADLRAQVRFSEARSSVTAELQRAGARSPALLFDAAKGELEFDDDGKPQNAAVVIQKLKEQYPEQFGGRVPTGIDAGAGQVTPPRLTRSALARMKPAEIAELDWAEVRRVLAAN